MNEVHITGYVFKPEEKQLSNGKKLIRFALKYTNGKDKDGKWLNAFLPVKIFAEGLSLKDNAKAEVWGRIACDDWTDKEGKNHKTTYLFASRVESDNEQKANRQNWDNQSTGATNENTMPF